MKFKTSPHVLLAAIAIATTSALAGAAVRDTPPSSTPNYAVNDNGNGLSRGGPIATYPGCAYPEGEDILAPWRQDRGFVKPSEIPGLLSNPYHKTGLAMNVYSGVPDNYTGHVPVYSEGNNWPFVGPQQLIPSSQISLYGSDRDLVQDAGLYFVNGEVVETEEPLFVKGVDRLKAVNKTGCSFIITAGSFPGTEQPGQVMTVLHPNATTFVPLAPEGWWPDAVVPETYSSVAGLNPLHIPGWHRSSWSPMYQGGQQSRDFGTPGFAYNLDPNVDYNPGITQGVLFANLRTAEGYDPLVSGDPGYGMAFYIDNELRAVIDMVKTNDYEASATLVAHSYHNPQNFQQGPITVAGAIMGVQPNQSAEYHYLTHEAAQALINDYRNRPNFVTVTEHYDSNRSAVIGSEYIDPVLPGSGGSGTATDTSTDTDTDSGSDTVTDTNTGSDTDTGTGTGPTSSKRLEAENAQMLGTAEAFPDQGASNQSAVGGTYGQGNGIRFTNVPASSKVVVHYASEFSGKITYFVNQVAQGSIEFNATGAWAGSYTDAEQEVNIPEGASFGLVFQGGDTAMNIDYVEFIGSSGGDTPTDTSTGSDTTTQTGTDTGTQTHVSYDPGTGNTILLIGQNVYSEYEDYVAGSGKAPAGASHYGSIYSGTVRGGVGSDTDSNAANHFNRVNGTYPASYSMIAVNIKANTSEGGYSNVAQALVGIANGEMDENIDRFASLMSGQPDRKFLMRIGYEVDRGLFGSGDQFARAYNHIAHRLRVVKGVENVNFIYHPRDNRDDATTLYPGSEYVDFVGFSVFNSGVCLPIANVQYCQGRLNPGLQASMEWAQSIDKPIAIAESAPRVPAVNSAQGMNDYLDRLFDVVSNYDVRLLSYIHTDWLGQGWPSNEWGDSRLTKYDSVMNSWLDEVNQARYKHYLDISSDTGTQTGTGSQTDTDTQTGDDTQTLTDTDTQTGTDTGTSDEYFYIVHKATGKKVHTCGPNTGTEVEVVDGDFTGTCAQWERVTSNGRFFFLRNVAADGYIRPRGLSNGIPIKLHSTDWTGNYTQWSYETTGDGFGYLVNRQTKKYAYSDGDVFLQESKNWKGDFTRWQFVPVQ